MFESCRDRHRFVPAKVESAWAPVLVINHDRYASLAGVSIGMRINFR
jgi:hypothetical protein